MSIMFPPSMGYLGPAPKNTLSNDAIIDDEPHQLHRVVVHRFDLRDVDDPDIYAAGPIYTWEQSEAGKWVNEHALETPQWHRQDDPMSFVTKYAITALFKEQDYSLWILKYT